MREIEFRGKRADNGEWVYGGLINKFDADAVCVSSSYIIERSAFSISADSDTTLYDVACLDDYYEVDEATVCQFTGLKDKNGVKIYEGDIVKIGSQIGYIVYNYGSFGIGLSEGIDYKKLEQKTLTWLGIENDNFLPLLEVYWNFNDEDEVLSEVKVIGNRYDNPELIKESE